MKFILYVFIFLNSLLLLGQTPSNDPHWELVWEDNFNSLNTNIWYIQDNFDHYGGERQVFIDDNVYVQNGSLVCEINQETYSCPSWAVEPNWHCVRQYNTGQPYSYTSGWAESKQAFNTKFGYIEARIIFPYATGLWPAFWTFVGDGVPNGTNAAEIDIAEMLGELGPNVITTNIHKNYPDDYFLKINPLNGYNWGDWHTYGIEWSPSKITWYLDGAPIRTFPNHGIIDPVRLILGIGLRPNVSLKGMQFPFKMYTDYVKVYDLKKDCGTDLSVCNYWFPNYDNHVKKTILIGIGGCTNIVFSGQNIFMRAAEGITINGNFEVQLGGELYLDVNPCTN